MEKLNHLSIFGIIVIVLILSFSCSFTESENVQTSGIWVSYVVQHRSNSDIEARAVLRVGGPLGTILEMSSGERITCNGVTLAWATLYYYTEFNSPAPGNEYTFIFHRVDEEITTVVTVPDSPASVTTNPAVNYNEWDPLDVNWDPSGSESGDYIDLHITGTDIHSFTRSGLTDNGSYSVNDPKGTGITSTENAVVSPIDVLVKRCRSGSVNSDYQGGLTRGERWDVGVTIDNFQPKLTLGITISPENSGSVTAEGSTSATTTSGDYRKYEMSEEVILTAVPIEGWAFESWSGDITGIDNPYTISEITSNMSVTAHFGAP